MAVMTIYKYPLTLTGRQVVALPARSTPISVGLQDRVICMWAIVPDGKLPKMDRSICIYGTWHDMGDIVSPGQFLGTVQQGIYVWHVFDEGAA